MRTRRTFCLAASILLLRSGMILSKVLRIPEFRRPPDQGTHEYGIDGLPSSCRISRLRSNHVRGRKKASIRYNRIGLLSRSKARLLLVAVLCFTSPHNTRRTAGKDPSRASGWMPKFTKSSAEECFQHIESTNPVDSRRESCRALTREPTTELSQSC